MTIKIWSYETYELIHTLEGHTDDVLDVKHIHNTKFIMSCSEDETIKIWSYETYELLGTLTGHSHSVRSLAHI